MLSVRTRPFEPGDAELYVALAADAFSIVPAWARPRDSREYVAHLHGAANPAGRALVSLCELEGRIVGHFSGLPFRFRRADGSGATGWQMSCLAVSASAQRRGVGQAMVADLLRELARTRPADFAYVFPNPRSLGVFARLGGAMLARVPTRIAPPASSRARSVPDGAGVSWTLERLDAAGARAALPGIERADPAPGGFVRDEAFFRWRFLGPDADLRYRFLRLARADGAARLLALAEHRAKGLRFTVLVDGLPDPTRAGGEQGWMGLALRAAQRQGRPVYVTTNAPLRGGPLTIAVPPALDPRPVGTMQMPMPEAPAFAAELTRAPVVTGDWMSF